MRVVTYVHMLWKWTIQFKKIQRLILIQDIFNANYLKIFHSIKYLNFGTYRIKYSIKLDIYITDGKLL